MAKKDETDAKAQKVAKDSKDAAKESKETKKAEPEKTGFSPVEFLQGTREELDKVVWPSRQQLISESVAVILMVTLSATLIYLVDQLFGWAARQVF
ncbi:preprotein translocase subunit SecE [Leptolyngbya ohadii]|uniref:preprotein translocase subunit SecE n=1 Tax=Leptolyngbya ohadii TaxID=1962290 RepID=UPI000B59E961